MRHPLQRHVEMLFRRLQHAFRVGYTSGVATDGGAAQGVQVRFHELSTQDEIWVGQQFGHGSNLPVGTRVLVVGGHGDPTSAVIVATNHEPSRVKGTSPGQSWMHDQAGTQMLFTNDGNASLTLSGVFTIKIGSTRLVFSEAGLAVTGGAVTSTGDQIAGLGTEDQVTQLGHKHTSTGVTSPTSVPIPGT